MSKHESHNKKSANIFVCCICMETMHNEHGDHNGDCYVDTLWQRSGLGSAHVGQPLALFRGDMFHTAGTHTHTQTHTHTHTQATYVYKQSNVHKHTHTQGWPQMAWSNQSCAPCQSRAGAPISDLAGSSLPYLYLHICVSIFVFAYLHLYFQGPVSLSFPGQSKEQ